MVKDAWIVVAVWAAIIAVSLLAAFTGFGASGLFDRMEASQASVSGSESAEGAEIIDALEGDGETVSLLVQGVDLSSEANQQEIAQALTNAHQDLVTLAGETNVADPFVVPGMLTQPAAQALASQNLDSFLMVITVNPNGNEVADRSDPDSAKYFETLDETVQKVEERLAQVPTELNATAAGAQATGIVSHEAIMTNELNDQVRADLVRGELIALPVSLIVMVLVFGGFLAAGMPMMGALASIGASLGIIWVVAGLWPMQNFVLNIVSVVGLGLSIDYALLITSRFREELVRASDPFGPDATQEGEAARRRTTRRGSRRTAPVALAMEATLNTAGRTVAVSGLTVAVAMLSLALVGTAILRTIAIAGIAVVVIAVAAALTLIPALLVLAGERINRPSIFARIPALGTIQATMSDVTTEEGVFSRLARFVHRFPWPVLAGSVLILVVLASPLRHMHMLNSTTELLPPNSDHRTYLRVLDQDYPASAEVDATLVIAGTGDEVNNYLTGQVASAPGVEQIVHIVQAGDYTVAYLNLAGDGIDRTSEAGVDAVRAIPAPADRWVTGQAASQVDFWNVVRTGLLWVSPLIVLATFVLLFLMTGSVLVPIKALLVNALSLASSLGVLTWIFQEGHGASLLGFTPIGGLESYVVITALAVGFGLAMDYEVFILARVKEFWAAGATNDEAVEKGLQRSGRIVTFAALIMVLVFLGFVTGDLLVIKQIGFALAVIVALDATLVRMLLVPATMTLLGEWNWWAPESLKKLHDRYGITH